MDLITPGDVLGMSWSRTLSGLAAALTQIPPCPIVQLTGAVPPPDGRDLLDLVRSVARIGGGPAHVFYAPMILDDAQTAAAIRRQGDIAEAFALVPSVTIAVVAIGAWAPGLSTIYDAVTPAERDALAALGVCAELAGVFIGEDGRPVATPLDSRMIVTPGPALERIPFVLAVAYGVAKSPAVCAAIRGGLVHGLVTHASLARALLGLADRRPAALAAPDAPADGPLPGGTANRGLVIRVGDTVRRPTAPCWRATHALLAHLAAVGFDGAPRVLAAGPLHRDADLHRRAGRGPAAGRGHADRRRPGQRRRPAAPLPPRRGVLRPGRVPWPRPIPARFRTGLVSHNDVHPANLVFRDGRAVGLIDFDLAGPGSAAWDFAAAARYWAPLQDEQDIADSRQGRALERFRIFLRRQRAAPRRPPSRGRGDRGQPRLDVRDRHRGRGRRVTRVSPTTGARWREPAARARRWCPAPPARPAGRGALTSVIAGSSPVAARCRG